MSDLNRIKQAMVDGDLAWCVDEIERLSVERDAYLATLKALDADEIERLQKGCDNLHEHIADKDKEIERLRAELEQAQRDCNANAKRNGRLAQRITSLEKAIALYLVSASNSNLANLQ